MVAAPVELNTGRHQSAQGIRERGLSDHGVSEALYLRDPNQNGVELYWDRPKDEWPRTAEGNLAMFTRALDLTALLAEGGASNDAVTASPG